MNSKTVFAKGADEPLALLGGRPAFSEFMHVGCPNLGDRASLSERINGMLDSRWLSNNGPLVKEFESRIADFVGVRHCVVMCNATVALQVAIRALDLQREVIVPSYTFVATAHALQWLEITPIFCDIDPITHNMDPARIEGLITPQTTGIIGVHLWGRPCDSEAIQAIADRRGLKVMYDAAHAFGCSHNGQMIGNFGACEVFSFHATKFLNSFEGGAVVTNDGALAEKLRLVCNFGFAGPDRVVCLGVNGKMTEVCAAMGLTSLEAIDEIIAINRRNYECYQAGLKALPGLSLIEYPKNEKTNYQYIVLTVDPNLAPLNRDELVTVLHAENVLARKYFWPGCHKMEPYRSDHPNAQLLVPQTEWLASRIIVLPTGQVVEPRDIEAICGIIAAALQHSGPVRQKCAEGR